MITSKPRNSLIAYSISHFIVDFCCFYFLLGLVRPQMPDIETYAIALLSYNIVAFGVQALVGIFYDRYPRLPMGLIGVLLVGLALLPLPSIWLRLIIIGLGNAAFHIGGGVDSLVLAKGMTRSGIFVSTGAIGVLLGTMAGQAAISSGYVWVLLALAIVLLLFNTLGFTKTTWPPQAIFKCNPQLGVYMILLLACLSIVIRSFSGVLIPKPWVNDAAFLTFMPAIASALGKALGGIGADKFGPRLVGSASLVLAALLFAFASQYALTGILGIFFFNICMPITLCTIYAALPTAPGLSFGLTTLALLIGNMPLFYMVIPANIGLYLVVITSLISAVCIYLTAAKRPSPLDN